MQLFMTEWGPNRNTNVPFAPFHTLIFFDKYVLMVSSCVCSTYALNWDLSEHSNNKFIATKEKYGKYSIRKRNHIKKMNELTKQSLNYI